MPVDPEERPFIDLVQIRCPPTEADPDGSLGSGWLVRPGIVLTALHCVAIEKQGWIDRESIEVYLWRDLHANAPIRYIATVEWPPLNRSDPADIAVLKIQKSDAPEPCPFLVAAFCELPGGEFRGETVGFPRAAAGPGLTGGRVEHREYGNSFLSSAARPTLQFRSTGETEQAGKDAWSGLSGGPLRCEGAIVGVMREVPEHWDGRSVLGAEPLPALLRNQGESLGLRRWLGLRGPLPTAPQPMAAVPAQPASPAFKADPAFIRLLDYLYTLDRLDEIDVAMPQIGQHVGNRPVEVLVAGHPEDRCNDFYFRLWHEILNATLLAADIDSAGAGPIPALQPAPPAPIAWPATGGGVDADLSALARRGLTNLMRSPGYSPSLAQLCAEMEKRTVALPFLALSLPRPPTLYDLSLLEKWRHAWRDIARARLRGQFVGYALLYSGSDVASEALLLPPDAEPRQVTVRLRELNKEHIRTWPDQLRRLEGGRPPGSPGAPLHTIAQDVLTWIDQYDVSVLRLETVFRLLLGKPDWYRATS